MSLGPPMTGATAVIGVSSVYPRASGDSYCVSSNWSVPSAVLLVSSPLSAA